MAGEWTWDIDPVANRMFLSLPDTAQEALVALMQGIIGDDPLGLRQQAAAIDPGGWVTRVPFAGEGIIEILIIVRGTHVQVMRIVWTGS